MKLETIAVHGGYSPDPTTKAVAVPIYQTTSYAFDDTQHGADLFDLKVQGNIYTRIMNPTTAVLEQRVAELEGGIGALAVASGMSAITYAIQTIAEAGDNIVSASTLYGGTYNQLRYTFPRLGIDTTFVDPADPEAFARAIRPNTRLIYGETLGNPGLTVFPFEAVGAIAREHRLPLVIDNTLATPYLCRPLEWGANVITHSTTKFLNGHGTCLGGLLVDGGTFDWASGRFAGFTEPDPSYHGLVYSTLGPPAFILKARVQMLRDLGVSASPFNSWMTVQGVETLSLRMERHVANAQRAAEFLRDHREVAWVSYPGLADHPSHELARKYLPLGAGAILTFGIRGGRAAGQRFIDSLRLFSHVANVGDAKSLAIHPASTTHSQLGEDELRQSGVTADMVRLSIGLEDIEDIFWDLDQALAATR